MNKKTKNSNIDILRNNGNLLLKQHIENYKDIEENIFKSVNGDINLYGLYINKIIENKKYINDSILKNGENIHLTPRELLCPEKWQKLQDQRLPKNTLKEKKKGTMKCPRCKSWYSEYTTAQTRSADEPSTLFFLCLDCEYRWKM